MKKTNKLLPDLATPRNSLHSSSAFEISTNLQRTLDSFLVNYPFKDLAIQTQKLVGPMHGLGQQINNLAAILKSYEPLALASRASLAFKQADWLQNFPFSKVTKALECEIESLQFREFDLIEWPENEIILPTQEVITQTNKVKDIIRAIYQDHQFLFKLTSRQFEEVVAELLENKGFHVELTKQTRDNGYDILALKDLNGFPLKFLVECKKYASSRPIGIEIIRSFCDVVKEENANKGIICTTSYFTSPAKERKIKEGHMLDLHDRSDLLHWVIDYLKI